MNNHILFHALFQTLGISIGFYIYRCNLKQNRYAQLKSSFLNFSSLFYLLVLILFAIFGSHLPYILYYSSSLYNMNFFQLFSDTGITIVGALCFAWLGSELYRKFTHNSISTGDEMVIPLCIGMSIGRIGCFIMGLDEDTYGLPTQFFMGYDFGDGILRHPTQLYDIYFLLFFGIIFKFFIKHQLFEGKGIGFNLFLFTYLFWRFSIDFIKPVAFPVSFSLFHHFYTISNIQIFSLVFGVASLVVYFLKAKKSFN